MSVLQKMFPCHDILYKSHTAWPVSLKDSYPLLKFEYIIVFVIFPWYLSVNSVEINFQGKQEPASDVPNTLAVNDWVTKIIRASANKILTQVSIYIAHDDIIKYKRFTHYWPFVRGMTVTRNLVSLICIWTNAWASNGDAGDLRHHRTHHDVNVMPYSMVWCYV